MPTKVERIKRICEGCGAEFERLPWQIAKLPCRWCSRTCAAAARVGEGNPRFGKHIGEMRTCKTCGKEFYEYPSNIGRGKHKNLFCSNACYTTEERSKALSGLKRSTETRARISALKTGKPNPNKRKPPTVLICAHCGDSFTIPGRKHFLVKQTRFCSRDCWYSYVLLHPEESGSFKDGGAGPYMGKNWKHQAMLARDRDGHTCQICGFHRFNPRLHVHHIKPRRDFAGDWEAANVLENLITLCGPCHIRVERAEVLPIIP